MSDQQRQLAWLHNSSVILWNVTSFLSNSELLLLLHLGFAPHLIRFWNDQNWWYKRTQVLVSHSLRSRVIDWRDSYFRVSAYLNRSGTVDIEFYRSLPCIEIMFECGRGLRAREDDGWSTGWFIVLACIGGNPSVLAYLIEKGARLNTSHTEAIELFCDVQLSKEIYSLLLSKGLEFNTSRDSVLPLLLRSACRYRNWNAIDALLEQEKIDVRPSMLMIRYRAEPEDDELLQTLQQRHHATLTE